jgi:predicted permease
MGAGQVKRSWPGIDARACTIARGTETESWKSGMTSVVSLALPFFGLIFLGFACGKLIKLPEAGLQWMNFFIIYLALPALFIKLIAPTPFEQLTNWSFVATTGLSTYICFAIAFGIGIFSTKGDVGRATMQGVAGSYSNVGYMGPPLMIAALGPQAVVPTALIFVFDCILIFTLVPFLMATASGERMKLGATAMYVVKRVAGHPFNIATAIGVVMAYFRWEAPAAIDTMLTFLKNAAAPCALFAMGVTVALRPLKRAPVEVMPLLVLKLLIHPLIVWVLLSLVGDFGQVWTYVAILMAALPPALNVFIIARQYDTYVEEASAIVLLGTLASTITLTAALVLAVEGRIPYDLFPG